MDVLSVAVEASIGLAGFAGIVSAVRKPEDVRRTEAVMLTMIVWLSLVTFLNASIALALFELGAAESTVWATLSASIVLVTFVGTGIAVAGMKGSLQRSLRANPLNALWWLLPIALGLLNLMNIFGIVVDREPVPLFLTGLLAFITVSYYFARLILDPVWAAQQARRRRREALATDDG